MELEQLTPRVYQLPFSQENDRPKSEAKRS